MKKLISLLITYIIILALSDKLFAQCVPTPETLPLPDMFLSKAKGKEILDEFSRDRVFSTSKFTRMKKITSIKTLNSNVVYRWKAFESLMTKVPEYDHMRIHFAIYQECNIPDFPKLDEPMLILLFSPEIARKTPQEFYFINENDDVPHIVPPQCAKSWIGNFERLVQVELRKTISSGDTENTDDSVPEKFSDTKSIVYTKEVFETAFKIEQIYQTKNYAAITAIRIDLSAYTKKGRDIKLDDSDQYSYKKRMLLQFNYMKWNAVIKGDEIFDLEDQPDFECRWALSLKKEPLLLKAFKHLTKKQKLRFTALDNGQLCPTHCP